MRIPLFKPVVGDEEHAAVARVLESGTLTRGQEVVAFEEEFAEYVGLRHAVAVSSGTAALHLLALAVGWSEGSRVVMTPFSYVASGNVLRYVGAEPLFVDIDPESLNMPVDAQAEAAAAGADGILLVHVLGLPADVPGCGQLARRHGLRIVEDACEALGRSSDAFPVARCGAGAAFSFHANKPITTAGEGGMVVTDDDDVAAHCRSLRDQGHLDADDWLERVPLGFNYRLTEVQAAFGRAQLQRLPGILETRTSLAVRYGELLAGIPGLRLPSEPESLNRSWFSYFVRLDSSEARDQVATSLRDAGVGVHTNLFPPIAAFSAFRDLPSVAGRSFPEAQAAFETLLGLPLHTHLSDDDVRLICDVLRAALPIATAGAGAGATPRPRAELRPGAR
jgi:perosamine synthetase